MCENMVDIVQNMPKKESEPIFKSASTVKYIFILNVI